MKTGLLKKVVSMAAAISLLTVAASPAYAVDSPTAVTSPTLNVIDDGHGKTGKVIFTDKDGNTYTLPDDVDIQVHDYTDIGKGELPAIAEALERASGKVGGAAALKGLTSEVEDYVDKYNSEHPDSTVNVDDLVTIDIFDVSLVHLKDDGNDDYVIPNGSLPDGTTATFEITLPFDIPDFFMLMHEIGDDEWIVETDVVKVNNNTLRVTTKDFGPFALVVQGDHQDDNSGAGQGNNDSKPSSTSSAAKDNNSATASGNNTNPNTGSIALGISAGAFILLGAGTMLTRNKDEEEK